MTNEPTNPTEGDLAITLNLLTAIERNSSTTQRFIARDLGIALGLANSYLKRCVKKGWIKVQQTPANRYGYYLTPTGFMEKSALTARYLSISFDFYRSARLQCTEVLDVCMERGWKRIGLVGYSELVEIAIVCAHRRSLEFAGVIEEHAELCELLDIQVVGTPKELGPLDALIITNLSAPQETYDLTTTVFPPDRVLAPRMLNISTGAGVVSDP